MVERALTDTPVTSDATIGGVDAPAADSPWERIAALAPRLRDDVRVYRHRYRGRRWFVLQDPLRGQWQRLDQNAYRVVQLLDGERSVGAVHGLLASEPSKPIVSQDDVATILNTLAASELIDWGIERDVAGIEERHERTRRAQRLAHWRTPLSVRIRIGDPDALLEQNLPLARWLFGPAGALLGLLILLVGVAALIANWSGVTGYWSLRGFTAESLIALAAVYLMVKSVHELAHGLAAKRWGAEVHEAGVMLLLLMPVPYVDASGAWAFADKWRRITVGAAGIVAELILSALAVVVFVNVEVGTLKDLAYATMLVGGLSTLLFNGNPLLRFDGYYVLADLLEIPNLAQRANRYWGYLFKRYLFGIGNAVSPVTALGERKWFLSYGSAAFVYRIGIALTIALLVASELPVLGMVLAAWALIGQLLWPAFKQLRALVDGAGFAGHRARALGVSAALIACVLIVSTAVPIPLSTHAQGVIWLPEHANVRSGADGIVTKLEVDADAQVVVGQAILTLSNPVLASHIAALQWELRGLEAERAAARVGDRVKAQVLEENIKKVRADLDEARAQAAERTVVAPVAGKLVLPDARDLPGRHVRKGEIVAYVLEDTPPVVRVAVPQEDAGRLRDRIEATEVRLAESPGRVIAGTVARETPSATHELPSPALGARGGGPIAVDPSDERGVRAMSRLFVVDVVLEDEAAAERVGGRAYVRFRHPAEPVAERLYRGLRQLLLTRLAV